MKEVVINGCYGGFGVSPKGVLEILKKKGLTVVPEDNESGIWYGFLASDGERYGPYSFSREDAELIACIKEYGSAFMSGSCSLLEIETYDDENCTYEVDEYDGVETLKLIPVVSEKKLSECNGVEEIMDYLEALEILVKRNAVD